MSRRGQLPRTQGGPGGPSPEIAGTRSTDGPSPWSDAGRREGPLPESAAWNILAYLLAGLLAFGLPGWLLDRWLGTSWVVLLGILAGAAVSLLTIWVRYGTERS